jgi:hypothetical protein
VQHTFTVNQNVTYVSDFTASKPLTSPTVVLAKVYALINAFHDEESGTEGIAFGTLSTKAGSMLVDLDAYFLNEMYLRGHRVPTIYVPDSNPTTSDGDNGDIWIQYTE